MISPFSFSKKKHENYTKVALGKNWNKSRFKVISFLGLATS